MNPRRSFFRSVLGLGAGAAALAKAAKAQHTNSGPPLPVVTPDIADLPFTTDNGVKVFHLIAEPVKQVIIPDRTFDLWGFNGSAPGPTIQATEGDRVRIVFDNHLPEPTGIHWHGLELPIEMDGVPGVSQGVVPPGERFVYEFSIHQNGTFFYHPHMAMQEMVGMLGGFIIHPKTPYSPRVDKDYLVALQEYAVLPNSTIPNSMSMEFNWLTFNGKSGPASTPLIIRHGERGLSTWAWTTIPSISTGSRFGKQDERVRGCPRPSGNEETQRSSASLRHATSSSLRTASEIGCFTAIFPTT
jgi:FtsP/CotA-like multicopper oxidase with cupredoxin domain